MHLPAWLMRVTISAALVLGSAFCGGWKWDGGTLLP
jgi:hypothetical protein